MKEQSAILVTDVDNSSSQGYSDWNTNGGNNTQDRIFLLSYEEANRYLGVTHDGENNTKACVAPTAYAIAQGAYISDSIQTADGKPAGWWWLRSPGYYQNGAGAVACIGTLSNGVVDASDTHYSYGDTAVCPVLWINLESDIF